MERPRILLVEDDEDTRALLVVALDAEGFRVDQAADAEAALRALRARRYALVMTDYDLPGKTGASLLREAKAAGLLGGTAILVVTAHPDPEGVDPKKVMFKPLDLDRLVRQVRRLIPRAPGPPPAPPPGPAAGGPVELVLHVSAGSMASARASQVARGVIERYPPARVRLTIVDLADDPRPAEEDHVVFTPTLVKRQPEPPLWVVGDLGDEGVVADLLHTCGVEPIA
ncbi:MAG TPA: response regulator [Vicinamibacteria bacterium]|nr:response regulator [Vicinamibacteria bacterium]